MGYNIHITLADNWYDSENNPITPDLLEEISVISLSNASGMNPKSGEVIEQCFDSSFYWPNNNADKKCMFHLIDGQLVFKYIDDSQIEIAKDLASYLGAKVQGDEGEVYEYELITPVNRKFKAIFKFIEKLVITSLTVIFISSISTYLYLKVKS